MNQQNDSRFENMQSFLAKQQLLDTAKTTFQQLSGLLKNVTLYPESHPFLIALVEKLMVTIEGLMAGRNDVSFYFVSGELFFETHSMPIDQSIVGLIEQFTSRDIGGIVFKPGITTEELVKLAVLMNKEPSTLAEDGGIINIFSRENILHIKLHSVLLIDKKNKDMREGKKRAKELFLEAISAIKGIVRDIKLNQTITMRRTNTVIQAMVDNILDNRDDFIGLINLKMCDEYTFAHCCKHYLFLPFLWRHFCRWKKLRLRRWVLPPCCMISAKCEFPLKSSTKLTTLLMRNTKWLSAILSRGRS